MRTRWTVLVLVALAAAAVVGALRLDGSERTAAPETVSEHPVSIPEAARLVVVSRAMPMPSAHARRLSAKLEEGELPSAAVEGEVLTDTECVPDEEGISRCRNDVLLRDGRVIVLRHPHDMAAVPCLAPGETIRILPA